MTMTRPMTSCYQCKTSHMADLFSSTTNSTSNCSLVPTNHLPMTGSGSYGLRRKDRVDMSCCEHEANCRRSTGRELHSIWKSSPMLDSHATLCFGNHSCTLLLDKRRCSWCCKSSELID